MSNVNAGFGLRFITMLTGDAANVHIGRYRIPISETHAIGLGDPVMRMTSSSDLATPNRNEVDGLEYIERATGTTGTVVLGVVIGFPPNYSDLSENYYHASATLTRDALVVDDPNAIFEVQTDVTGCARTDLGKNCCMSMAAVNTTTGVSGVVATSIAATAAHPFLIMGFSRDPKNDITTAAYVKIMVKINNHQLNIGANYAALGV